MIESIPRGYEVIIYQQGHQNGGGWGTREYNETSPGVTVVKAWMPMEFQYNIESEYEAPFQQTLGDGFPAKLAAMMGKKLLTPVMTAQLWTGSAIPTFQLDLEFETDSEGGALTDIKPQILALMKMVTPKISSAGMLESPGPQLDPQDALNLFTRGLKSVGSSLLDMASDGAEIAGNFGKRLSEMAIKGAENLGIDTGSLGKTTNTEESANDTSVSYPNTAVNDLIGLDGSSVIRNQISIAIGRYLYFPSVVITAVNTNFLNLIELQSGFPLSAKVSLEFKPMFMPTQSDLDLMFGNQ